MKEIIQSFDLKQQKEFEYFIQRNKYRKNRKDLKLFKLLTEERSYSPDEMVKELGTSNLNGYHTIRKRLFDHLADFIIVKSMTEDAGPFSHINSLIGIVNYLFEKGLIKYAWKYLVLAESLAMQHQYYGLLNNVYLLQIEKIQLQSYISLEEVITRYNENRILLEQEEKLKIASAIVKDKFKHSGEWVQLDYQNMIEETLSKAGIDDSVLTSPRIVLNFIRIIRRGIMAKKEFYQFEDLLITYFQNLFKEGQDVEPSIMFEFLYFIAHALYRNRKFDQSLKYLNKMKRLLNLCPLSFRRQYAPVYYQLLSANYVMIQDIDMAILNLNTVLEGDDKLRISEELNTIVNLGIYHFLKREFLVSRDYLKKLKHTDNWYQKTMGVEWVLKKNIMEVILYAELEEYDLVESRIRSVERKYRDLRSNPIYERAFGFLMLIKNFYLIRNRDSEWLSEQIEEKIHFLPVEQEDIQAMAFYSWLKSKAVKQDYYETLLEVVKE